MSPHRRADLAYLAAILLGVLVVVLLGPLDRRLEILHINDFSGFWAGPRAVLAGVSPWDPAHYPQARIAFDTQRDDASVLNYMPWTVIALLPLGLLPLDAAAWLRFQGFERAKSLAGGIERWSVDVDSSIPRY